VPLHNIPECQHAIVNSAAGGTLAIVSGVTAPKPQRVGIYRMILFVGAATTLTLQDTASNALAAPWTFGAGGGSLVLDTPINGDPWWQAGAGLGVQFSSTAAVQVSADIWYLQGP